MTKTRRGFMAGTVTLLTAGCVGSGETESSNSSEETELQEDPNEPIDEFTNSDVVQSSVDDLRITEHEFSEGNQEADVQGREVVLSDVTVRGVVENTSSNSSYQNVTVTLTLLDANRDTIGYTDDWSERLEAGNAWTFEIVPDIDTTFDEVETYRLEVDADRDTSRIKEAVEDSHQD